MIDPAMLAHWTRIYHHARPEDAIAAVRALATEVEEDTAALQLVVPWLVDHYATDRAAWVARLAEIAPVAARVETLWLTYQRGERADGTTLLALEEATRTQPPAARARFALVVGKLASDGGALDTARRWLLLALQQARRSADMAQGAAAFGALGEVFYLGGQPLIALDAIGADQALLPPGSAQHERLAVYRAHAYRVLGELEAARGLYHQTHHSAQLRGHSDQWARRGLVWCDALDAVRSNRPWGPLGAAPSASHPRGMTLLVDAWLRRREGDHEGAATAHALARDAFATSGYSQELAVLDGSRFDAATYPDPRDTEPDACDQWYASIPLQARAETLAHATEAYHEGHDLAALQTLTAAFF